MVRQVHLTVPHANAASVIERLDGLAATGLDGTPATPQLSNTGTEPGARHGENCQ